MKSRTLQMIALVVLSGGAAAAQVTTGTILGTVRDSTGAVLPRATVVLLNEETGISRTVVTDAAGRYSALSLSLGNYRVTGTLDGFQTMVRTGIVLTVGREAVVDLALEVGTVAQTMEVTGEAPLVESTTASLGSLVDARTIRALPLNGRSYDQLALLQPGVVLFDPGAVSGTPFGTGTGKRFSVGGQRSFANTFLLDGTVINDQVNGTPGGAGGTNLGVDTIQEFKIFTNSFKAEYGRSSGAVVTAVTRSGTNTFHGTAFEYLRNSAMDARNFFDVGSSVPPFKRNQFGGVLGGPIRKDKVFIFGGYEGLRQGQGTTRIATVPTLLTRQGVLPTGTVQVHPDVVPILNVYPVPNGRDFGDGTAEFLSAPTVVTNEDYVSGRLDYQLSSSTGVFGRYIFDEDDRIDPTSLPAYVIALGSRRQYTTLQANSVLGPQKLNNFRFAFNRTSSAYDILAPGPGPLSIIPGQPLGAFQIGGLGGAGTRALAPLGGGTAGDGASLWLFNVFEWGDDFSYVTGKHSFKTGADIQRIQDNTVRTTSLRGSYTFPTLGDFLAGRPSVLQAAAPLGAAPYWKMRQTIYAVYAQDDYTVSSRLTLNLGLRWEAATDPKDARGQMAILPSPSATSTVASDSFVNVSKKNFEPRVGLAWKINDNGTTVLRAGGGIYHNQILPWHYQNQLRLPPFYGVYATNNPPFPAGYQVLGASLQTLRVLPPKEKVPVTNQYNLSVQHELRRNTVLEVAYAGSQSSHQETARETNTPIPTLLDDGRKLFPAGAPRRNRAWVGVNIYETDGNAVYNSVRVTLRRQSSSGFQGQIFYTFSKATDASTALNGQDSVRAPGALLDGEDRNRDWSLSETDSRHGVVFYFTYPVPFRASSRVLGALVNGWAIDGIGTFTAGLPFNARLSGAVSRDQSTTFAERPDLRPGADQNPNSGTTAGCAGIPEGEKLGTADRFYDPCSFALPLAGTYGNLGRNTIIGPGLANLDFALGRTFQLGEKADATIKMEVFNILNHTNFGLPNNTAVTTTGAANASAGRVTYTTTSSRQIQFGLRIGF